MRPFPRSETEREGQETGEADDENARPIEDAEQAEAAGERRQGRETGRRPDRDRLRPRRQAKPARDERAGTERRARQRQQERQVDEEKERQGSVSAGAVRTGSGSAHPATARRIASISPPTFDHE